MKKALEPAPLTIGGWLMLIGIRLFLSVLSNGNSFVGSFQFHFELSPEQQILRAVYGLVVLYVFVILILFTKRHKAFPVMYIILESVNVIMTIVLFITAVKSPPIRGAAFQIVSFAASVVFGILWIVYMRRSERVKKTFVYSWNQTPDRKLIDKTNGVSADTN